MGDTPHSPQIDLFRVNEIMDLMGVSRTRADELTRRCGFPPPAAVIGEGTKATRYWLASHVRAWHQAFLANEPITPCPTCGQASWTEAVQSGLIDLTVEHDGQAPAKPRKRTAKRAGR